MRKKVLLKIDGWMKVMDVPFGDYRSGYIEVMSPFTEKPSYDVNEGLKISNVEVKKIVFERNGKTQNNLPVFEFRNH